MLSLESSIPGGVRGDIRLVAEEENDAAEERDNDEDDDDDDDAVVDDREKKGIETTGVEDDVDDDDDDVEDVDVDDCGWAADAADCRAAGTKEEANAPAKVAAEEARDEVEVEEEDEEDDDNNDDAEYDDRSFGAAELLPRPAEDDAAGREAALVVLSYELKADVAVAEAVSASSTSIRGRLAAFDGQSPSEACCWAPVAFTVGGSSTIPCLSPHKHHAQQ